MTVIVGIRKDDGTVYMGGDSAGVSGIDISIMGAPKVFRVGPFLFGFCGSFRMGQLLQHSFTPPTHPKNVDDYKYMVTKFVDALRVCFKQGGYSATITTGEETGGLFLVGYNGALYRIDEDYQVGIPGEGFTAIGCGDSYALGALYATAGMPELDRAEIALNAAQQFSGGVRAPFTYDWLTPGEIAKAPRKPRKRK